MSDGILQFIVNQSIHYL